jgi:hypothetical protein
MRNSLNFCRLPYGLIRREPPLGVNQVGREDGVNEGGLSESSLACTGVPQDRRTKKVGRKIYVTFVSTFILSSVATVRRTNNDDIELETTLQELVLNLLRDRVETDVGLCTDFLRN